LHIDLAIVVAYFMNLTYIDTLPINEYNKINKIKY